MRIVFTCVSAAVLAAVCPSDWMPFAAADPLPSWRSGDAKQSIIDFVDRVTEEGGDDFVPVAARIAVFDNDGTLWCEAPVPPQAAFAASELQRMLPDHPEWKDDADVQAFMKKDMKALTENHNQKLVELIGKTHAGRSPDDFSKSVNGWLSQSKHPRFQMAYNQTVYQPMLELLSYLRDNDFQTWIVSGGGQDFMRVLADETYGIIPQRVIGSYGAVSYETKDGVPTFVKTIGSLFVDDKNGKPEAIHRFIGRQSIACFGNSDGDQAMMEYTTLGNEYPSLAAIVHHTDAEREYAYDSDPPSSGKLVTGLTAAKEHGWTVIDMKNDWKTVFPSDQ